MQNMNIFLLGLTSDDPKERQQVRRDRLKKRHEHAASALHQIENKNETGTEKAFLESTIDNCNENLFQIFVGGKTQITNVRVSADTREIQRRVNELSARNVRLMKLEEEASQASEKLLTICNKWNDIHGINDPLDLCDELKNQKSRCASLVEQKDALINDLKEELKLADERYVNDRNDMLTDTDIIARRINEQVLVMKRSYTIELDQIEDAVKATRNDYSASQKAAWSELFGKMEENEGQQVAEHLEMLETGEEEIKHIYVMHDIKFHDVKISLETDVQALEQELERIKAICLVNSEKLDYNYQVLKKREDENIIIKNSQKRMMNKLQDEVTKLRKKKEEKENEASIRLAKINKEISHLHSSIVDIESKSDHFSKVNNQQFLDIWRMKTKDAAVLLKKISSADRVIHEKILGAKWQASDAVTKPLRMEDLNSYRSALAMMEEVFQAPTAVAESEIGGVQDESWSTTERRNLRAIFDLVADNTNFLTEEKLDEQLKPYGKDEKTLVRLDNVFHALGVRSDCEIALLQKHFARYTPCQLCYETSYALIEDGDSEKCGSQLTCARKHPLQIQRQDVLKILKQFVLKLYSSKIKDKDESVMRVAKDRCTVSRIISPDDIHRFWKSYESCFSKESLATWDELLIGLTRYYKLLQDRTKYLKKAQRLKLENHELLSLVAKYVNHPTT